MKNSRNRRVMNMDSRGMNHSMSCYSRQRWRIIFMVVILAGMLWLSLGAFSVDCATEPYSSAACLDSLPPETVATALMEGKTNLDMVLGMGDVPLGSVMNSLPKDYLVLAILGGDVPPEKIGLMDEIKLAQILEDPTALDGQTVASRFPDDVLIRVIAYQPSLLGTSQENPNFQELDRRVRGKEELLNSHPEVKKKWFWIHGYQDAGARIGSYNGETLTTQGEKSCTFDISTANTLDTTITVNADGSLTIPGEDESHTHASFFNVRIAVDSLGQIVADGSEADGEVILDRDFPIQISGENIKVHIFAPQEEIFPLASAQGKVAVNNDGKSIILKVTDGNAQLLWDTTAPIKIISKNSWVLLVNPMGEQLEATNLYHSSGGFQIYYENHDLHLVSNPEEEEESTFIYAKTKDSYCSNPLDPGSCQETWLNNFAFHGEVTLPHESYGEIVQLGKDTLFVEYDEAYGGVETARIAVTEETTYSRSLDNYCFGEEDSCLILDFGRSSALVQAKGNNKINLWAANNIRNLKVDRFEDQSEVNFYDRKWVNTGTEENPQYKLRPVFKVSFHPASGEGKDVFGFKGNPAETHLKFIEYLGSCPQQLVDNGKCSSTAEKGMVFFGPTNSEGTQWGIGFCKTGECSSDQIYGSLGLADSTSAGKEKNWEAYWLTSGMDFTGRNGFFGGCNQNENVKCQGFTDELIPEELNGPKIAILSGHHNVNSNVLWWDNGGINFHQLPYCPTCEVLASSACNMNLPPGYREEPDLPGYDPKEYLSTLVERNPNLKAVLGYGPAPEGGKGKAPLDDAPLWQDAAKAGGAFDDFAAGNYESGARRMANYAATFGSGHNHFAAWFRDTENPEMWYYVSFKKGHERGYSYNLNTGEYQEYPHLADLPLFQKSAANTRP